VLALKPKILLTGCPHCLRAFRELYPRWEIEWPGELRLLHTAQLIAERMDRGELRLRAAAALPRLAYHDPCQLARKLGEYEAPRRVLAAIGGRPPLELFHDREKAECCGAGSAMFLTDPDIALRVARNRLSSALETEAGMLVTACQNCKNVLGRAGDGASRIRVADICEVAAELL
jgi:Fe-S oxidoreductase